MLKFFLTSLFYNNFFGQNTYIADCPYFSASSTDSNGVVFSLASIDITATVSGVISNVIVEQLYLNSGDSIVDVTEMANTFKSYIDRPVLTNIEAIFEGIEVYDVEPLTILDVFAERPIIVYGKYHTPAEGSISTQGDYGTGNV